MSRTAIIKAIERYLPSKTEKNRDLVAEFPGWAVNKVEQVTGISERHVAAAEEYSSDLAIAAAKELFLSGACGPQDIDFILFCSQTPDYLLPASSCLVQQALGISCTAGAADLNLSSSGYVYALGVARGLIETGQARNILLLTADVYSKLTYRADRNVRAVFGDAATATLVTCLDVADGPSIGPFIYGSDGAGAPNLIAPASGMRGCSSARPAAEDDVASTRSGALFMDGPEIFHFALRVVPDLVSRLLARAERTLQDVDLFVFHQANHYMLEHLRKRINIPPEKFHIYLKDCGNTVSCTIPLALKNALENGKVRDGGLLMLVGFGAGYSWGATLVRWHGQV